MQKYPSDKERNIQVIWHKPPILMRDDEIERNLLFYNPYNWRETAGYQ